MTIFFEPSIFFDILFYFQRCLNLFHQDIFISPSWRAVILSSNISNTWSMTILFICCLPSVFVFIFIFVAYFFSKNSFLKYWGYEQKLIGLFLNYVSRFRKSNYFSSNTKKLIFKVHTRPFGLLLIVRQKIIAVLSSRFFLSLQIFFIQQKKCFNPQIN